MNYLAIALLFSLSTAHAKESEAFFLGTTAILCKNQDGSLKSARLLDLEEQSYFDELKPSAEMIGLSWKQQFSLAMNRLGFIDPKMDKALRELFYSSGVKEPDFSKTRDTRKVFLPPSNLGDRLPPIEENCALKGASFLSHYDIGDWNTRHSFSHYIWQNLPETDRAAAFMHDALNSMASAKLLKNEMRDPDVRRLVALLFSDRMDSLGEIKAEREKFRTQKFYQFPHKDGHWSELYPSLFSVASGFLSYPYETEDAPIYLSQGACQGGLGKLTVKVELNYLDAGKASSNCVLRSKAQSWPQDLEKAKFEKSVTATKKERRKEAGVSWSRETQTIPYSSTIAPGGTGSRHDETYVDNPKEEIISVSCGRDMIEAVNLYCGSRQIAHLEKNRDVVANEVQGRLRVKEDFEGSRFGFESMFDLESED